MFERYTEAARRALFFSRYESSQFGSLAIAPEHLLIGILREPGPLVGRILSTPPGTIATIRAQLADRIQRQEPVGTSVEIPFSGSTKRVLQYAAEEADRLQHRHIGPEHLLLGLVREEDSAAASVLADHGVRLDPVRQAVVDLSKEPGLADEPGAIIGCGLEVRQRSAGFDEYVALIKKRVEALAAMDNDAAKRLLVEEIHTALDSLRDRL